MILKEKRAWLIAKELRKTDDMTVDEELELDDILIYDDWCALVKFRS